MFSFHRLKKSKGLILSSLHFSHVSVANPRAWGCESTAPSIGQSQNNDNPRDSLVILPGPLSCDSWIGIMTLIDRLTQNRSQ